VFAILAEKSFEIRGHLHAANVPFVLVKETHLNPDGGPLQNAKGGR